METGTQRWKKEDRIRMTNTQEMANWERKTARGERWRSREEEGEDAPIPGMMSAFIDFVKPFPMLLPMCLQDSKSRSIRGDGGGARNAGRDIQVAGKEDHCPGANDNFAAF